MSDEPTAVSGDDSQAPPATPEAPPAAVEVPEPTPVTRETLDTMRKNRDTEGLRKIIDGANMPKGDAPAGEPPAQEPPQPPAAGEPPAGSEETKDSKFFDIRFQGEDVHLPDDDSYLGYGSFGKMKKAMAHQSKTMEGYETRINTAETAAARLRRENEEFRRKLASVPPAASPEPSATPPAAPPAPLGDVSIPTPPPEPEYSSDDYLDWTDDDRAKDAQYRKERRKYDVAMNSAMAKLVDAAKAPQQQGPYNNDPALVEQLREQGEFIEGLKGERATQAAEIKQASFWKAMDAFQGLHKELETPIPLVKLHEAVGSWMHGLAWANGVRPPENATEEQLKEYNSAKSALVAKFLKGDAGVVESAAGVKPPDGYREYFKVAEVQQRRNALVDEGVLGPRATLQDAWQKDYTDKELPNDVSAIEADARAEGAGAVLKSLGASQRDHAAHIPNSAATAPPQGEDQPPPGEMSKEEALRILHMPIQEVRRRGLEDKRKLIVSRLKES